MSDEARRVRFGAMLDTDDSGRHRPTSGSATTCSEHATTRVAPRYVLACLAVGGLVCLGACTGSDSSEGDEARSSDARTRPDTSGSDAGASSDANPLSDGARTPDGGDAGDSGDEDGGDGPPECRRVRYEHDEGGPKGPGTAPDGTPDDVRTYEYDERGRLVKETWEGRVENSDGGWGERETWRVATYEWGDDPTTARRDVDGATLGPVDGEPEYVVHLEYRTDGRLKRAEWDGFPRGSLDGEPDQIVEYAYDADDRRTRKREYRGASAKSEYLVESVAYTYGDHGKRIRKTIDGVGRRKPDDDPDEVWRYEYDDRKRRIRTERDYKNEGDRRAPDGQPDEVWLYRYSEDEPRVHEAYYDASLGPPGEGEPDVSTTYWYDDRGRKERVEQDGIAEEGEREPPDGEADEIWTYEYECRW